MRQAGCQKLTRFLDSLRRSLHIGATDRRHCHPKGPERLVCRAADFFCTRPWGKTVMRHDVKTLKIWSRCADSTDATYLVMRARLRRADELSAMGRATNTDASPFPRIAQRQDPCGGMPVPCLS